MRLTRFAALVALSLGVAAYAVIAYGFLPLGTAVRPDMRTTFATAGAQRVGIYVHVFASSVTLRIWLPASVVSGVPFEFAHAVVAGLCWLPNLAIAEWMLDRPGRPTAAPG